jgi:hypothetical protein
MRLSTILLLLSGSWVGASTAAAIAIGNDAPNADQSNDKPVQSEAAAKEVKEFKLPPGFVKRTRGKHVLYCNVVTPLGTRFKSERCYDEAQMRDYMIALKENKNDIDRVRNTCSNVCTCGRPEAC